MVRGAPGAAVAAGFVSSSSARPFLNDFTPLATSPIMSEILPLPPNKRSATAPNNIQCQMLKLPMAVFPMRARLPVEAGGAILVARLPKRAERQKQAWPGGEDGSARERARRTRKPASGRLGATA